MDVWVIQKEIGMHVERKMYVYFNLSGGNCGMGEGLKQSTKND